MAEHSLLGELDSFLGYHESELIEFRRDLHIHAEVGYSEHRTTRQIALRLEAAGLQPRILPKGTGLVADIQGDAKDDATIALRADIDALPITDEKQVSYRSQNPGACHACGHDAHTAILLGTGMFLAKAARAGVLPGNVRLIFQPAEEVPGGALDVIAAGGLASVERIFALHCDPNLDLGKIGTRIGSITAAIDKIKIRLTGPGGHTARPHLTADLVFALGKMITELPAALSRRMDPRSGMSLVWGRVSAGSASNAIPDAGEVEGTVRCLHNDAWLGAPDLLKELVELTASAYCAVPDFCYERGNPPTVNDGACTNLVAAAADRMLGPGAVTQAAQSLGGEDFAWYLESVPGSLFRLGTRHPGSPQEFDIHQPCFDIDERAIAVGVKMMAATALAAIGDLGDDGCGDSDPAAAAGAVGAVGAAADGAALTGPLLG